MSPMKLIFILIILFCVSINCTVGKKTFITKPIEIKNESFKIKLEGSYTGGLKNSVVCFFLYNNGVILEYSPVYHLSNINNLDSVKQQVCFTIRYKDSIFAHSIFKGRKEAGGFKIEGNKIQMQIMRKTPGFYWGLCSYSGTIINDSTIYINQCNFPLDPLQCSQDFYLSFIKMNKPDSTNQLMKKRWYWKHN